MKIFSPVAVALVSSCLVFFHSNPAFAAIIDIDAGAPPEDAALAPLDEPDDGTAAAATVIDAIPAEAASVPSRRRRRTLTGKKTGGGTPPTPAPPTPAPIACTGRSSTDGCNIVEDFPPPFAFKNQCTYDITVRGVKSLGNNNCDLNGGTNCFNVPSGQTRTELLPEVKEDGNTIYFSTRHYTEQEDATRRNCYGQAFCAALEIYKKERTIFNFDNQYSFGIPIGISYDDDNGPIQECPEANLDECKQNPSLCYSTKGRSDNCYFDTTPCPTEAWKVKTHPDEPVVWCLTNDSTLGVISALQDNTPADCPSAPSDWNSLAGKGRNQPLCSYNTNLYTAATQFLSSPALVVDLNGDNQFTPLNNTNADMIYTARPGGAKAFQAAINTACGQFTTQKISGNALGSFEPSYQANDRNVGNDGSRRKDHGVTFEGDQTYQYKWLKMSKASDQTPMMAGNTGIQCTDNDSFDKVKTITVTFCPTPWDPFL